MIVLARVVCVLMILSGIAGVVVGDASALAGWWLIVVFGTVLVLTFAWPTTRPAPRS
jgi:hypothetical protein